MRAVVLGGTGALGGATAATLAAKGWTVDVAARDAALMPTALTQAGVRFHPLERENVAAIRHLVGDDTGLLVDLVAFRAAHVRELLPTMASAGHTVVISTRAVYIDDHARHINGDEPPRFSVPIREDNAVLPPAADGVDPYTREGYAPSKVAVENAAIDSGLPVTVVRPSKVHGRWARNPRTRIFVERMLAGVDVIALADRGASVDHLTAAANTAALIATVADRPAQRILNSADPDTPTAEQIVRAIGQRLHWEGTLELLDSDGSDSGGDERGHHPWRSASPIVLDTSASLATGYTPVGTALNLLGEEIDWVAEQVRTSR